MNCFYATYDKVLKLIAYDVMLFNCRLNCSSHYKCNGYIDCPWLTPNDEANCSSQCPSDLLIPCDCNKPEYMKCKQRGPVCYNKNGKGSCFFICQSVVVVLD